jgi:hypothetical protein
MKFTRLHDKGTANRGEEDMKDITYLLDDEPQTTTERELAARQILQNAGIDPTNHYLVQIQGHEGKEKRSFRDNPDELIRLHPNMKFISVSTEPTPVS